MRSTAFQINNLVPICNLAVLVLLRVWCHVTCVSYCTLPVIVSDCISLTCILVVAELPVTTELAAAWEKRCTSH